MRKVSGWHATEGWQGSPSDYSSVGIISLLYGFYSFVAPRPGVQALGMLKIVLPDKYEDTIEFLDSSRSARTPGMTLTFNLKLNFDFPLI